METTTTATVIPVSFGRPLSFEQLSSMLPLPAEEAKYVPAYALNSNEFRGSKYDRNLSTKAVAALVRAELKAALPGVKASVRSDFKSIDLTIKSFGKVAQVFTSEFLAVTDGDYHGVTRYTPEAAQVIATAQGLLDAYRRDNSDISTDYFDTNFYGNVYVSVEPVAVAS